jgi:hypothetical protein
MTEQVENLRNVFVLIDRCFSILITAVFIFAVKGLIVLVYHNSSTPHVYTGEVASMWGLMGSGLLFFATTLALSIFDNTLYSHAQNINAYLCVLSGYFLYSIMAFASCAGADLLVCRFLYPISRYRTLESSIHVVLVFLLFISILSLALSFRWNRKLVPQFYKWAGLVFAVLTAHGLFVMQLIGISTSCPLDFSVKVRGLEYSTVLFMGVALVFVTAVLYIGLFAAIALFQQSWISVLNLADMFEKIFWLSVLFFVFSVVLFIVILLMAILKIISWYVFPLYVCV